MHEPLYGERRESDVQAMPTASYAMTEAVRTWRVIPTGEEELKIFQKTAQITRSKSLFDIKYFRSWTAVNFELGKVAYMNMRSDEASIVPILMWFAASVLVSSAGVLSQQTLADFNPSISTIVPLLVGFIWAAFFIRVLLWYFLRSSTVLFGVNNTPLGFTLMEFSRSKRDALVSAFLNALYTAKGYTGGVPTETAQDQFRSPTRCMGCIPDGQDSLELWPRHFRIKSTVGFLGYSFKADILQEKLETYLMADKIRWLHFGATARPFGALLLITPLTAGVVATFQLIGSRTSELGELESELLVNLSYVAMAGYGLFLVWYLFSTKKVCTFALDDTPPVSKFGKYANIGATFDFRMPKLQSIDEMKHKILHKMLSRPPDTTVVAQWEGSNAKQRNVLTLYGDHIECHLPAPSGCCGRLLSCCSDGDTYCVLLRDIESVFASEIKNAYFIVAAIFFLLLIVPTFLFFTGIEQFMPWHLALIWLGLALLMFLVYMCSQSATVAIGAVPGGAPNALSNPFGDSPFWVTFSPLQRDTSDIIDMVRKQQRLSAETTSRTAASMRA